MCLLLSYFARDISCIHIYEIYLMYIYLMYHEIHLVVRQDYSHRDNSHEIYLVVIYLIYIFEIYLVVRQDYSPRDNSPIFFFKSNLT